VLSEVTDVYCLERDSQTIGLFGTKLAREIAVDGARELRTEPRRRLTATVVMLTSYVAMARHVP